jgi:hypothetical protein
MYHSNGSGYICTTLSNRTRVAFLVILERCHSIYIIEVISKRTAPAGMINEVLYFGPDAALKIGSRCQIYYYVLYWLTVGV